MADQIEIQIPETNWDEGSAFTATAYYRTRSTAAASTPTTARYRIDCLETGTIVQDWATLTPASSISISITPTHTKIQNENHDYERKRLTVDADNGLSTQHRGSIVFRVRNLGINVT